MLQGRFLSSSTLPLSRSPSASARLDLVILPRPLIDITLSVSVLPRFRLQRRLCLVASRMTHRVDVARWYWQNATKIEHSFYSIRVFACCKLDIVLHVVDFYGKISELHSMNEPSVHSNELLVQVAHIFLHHCIFILYFYSVFACLSCLLLYLIWYEE